MKSQTSYRLVSDKFEGNVLTYTADMPRKIRVETTYDVIRFNTLDDAIAQLEEFLEGLKGLKQLKEETKNEK